MFGRSLQRHYLEDLASFTLFGRWLAFNRQRGIEQVLSRTQCFNSSDSIGYRHCVPLLQGSASVLLLPVRDDDPASAHAISMRALTDPGKDGPVDRC